MTLRDVSTGACWLAIVASFVLSASTWWALGVLAGFGLLAVAMPICVDGYVVTALATWLSPETSQRLANFARTNLYAVAGGSVLAQACYHSADIASHGQASWKVALAFVVGGFPPLIATLAAHIRARAVREYLHAPQSPVAPLPDPPVRDVAPSLSQPYRAPAPVAFAPANGALHQAMAAAMPGPGKSPQRAKPTKPEPVRPQEPMAGRAPKVEKESRARPRPDGTDLANVRQMVDDGATHAEIAQRLGVSRRTATRRIAEAKALPTRSLVVAK